MTGGVSGTEESSPPRREIRPPTRAATTTTTMTAIATSRFRSTAVPPGSRRYPPWFAIDRQPPVADEAAERDPTIPRELDRERGGSSDGGEDRAAGDRGLLHELEREPPTDAEEELAEREQALEERPADDLVERVVPADVLPRAQELTTQCEEPRRVQAASRRKRSLSVEQPLRQRCDDRFGDAASRPRYAVRRPEPPRWRPCRRLRKTTMCRSAGGARSGSNPRASTSTVLAARSSGTRAETGSSPSVRQNPRASSSSWPGVRIVTATGSPPIRISSGSSTARVSSPSTRAGSRKARTPAVE